MRNLILDCLISVAVALVSGCMPARTRAEYAELTRAVDATTPVDTSRSAMNGDEVDEALAREASLDTILRLALARNPGVQETRLRARAALERVPAAARRPDLEFKYEQWGVPLGRPLDLGNAQTLMFGLRQPIPAPGSLAARSRAALEESWGTLDAERAREQDVATQVRRTYFDYYRADREYRIHLQHVELATRFIALARGQYQAGRGSQQDVLRALVELSQLHNDLAAFQQARRSSSVLLNTLMARPPDAPLGPPPDFESSRVEVALPDLEKLLAERRPELDAARRSVLGSEATLAAARSEARWPSFMVGADYWYMPAQPSPHAYGAMLSFGLPWLNPVHREKVREAEQMLAADRSAERSAHNMALYELRDAMARLEAARQSLTILERDLLPQARQSFESAEGSYSAGRGDALGVLDALRSYLQVQMEGSRAQAALESSLADLERVVGTGIPGDARGGEGRRP